MSDADNDLFGIIYGITDKPDWAVSEVHDAVLAAGYRKPRTVTTVEELDALPVGSVVIFRDSKNDPHPAQKGATGWRLPFVDQFWTAEGLLKGSESAEVVEP